MAASLHFWLRVGQQITTLIYREQSFSDLRTLFMEIIFFFFASKKNFIKMGRTITT